jgi:hypothetical protein
MMPFAGLSIEYFVIGSVTVLWLLPAIVVSGMLANIDPDFVGALTAAAVPGIYVIGMACDGLASMATYPFKCRIEDKLWSELKEKKQSSQLVHVHAVCREPALAGAIEARSTRDRIARGSLVAALPLLFVPIHTGHAAADWAVGPLLVASFGWLWYRLQRLSTKYEAYAWQLLNEKHPVRGVER